ncbi:carbohydrate-binding protein [Paenibacillus sp. P96]|uniref:Carbohydrate-binding protein n=1 Tax=Paenibacillus zeirhizosphaerae TaxID=2987519 RepID=A0ABT9FLV0_9BACL|nr:CBM35 domain-containing protein [Paenibacillus sp. P96]MDP4095352.1 carbohydrate-binding protein [Paenibacillus sp. P96]
MRRSGLKQKALLLFLMSCMILALVALPQPIYAATAYEAEDASLAGGALVESNHAGYSGSGFIGGFTDSNKGSASVSFAVESSAAGDRDITLRYANGTGAAMTLSLYVNGAKTGQLLLPATSAWDEWGTKAETVTLHEGSNTVQYRFDATDSGNVNLDHIVVGELLPEPEPEPEPNPGSPDVYQAEEQFFSGGVVRTGNVLRNFDSAGARVIFTVNSASTGNKDVTLRYAKSTGESGVMNVYVNGVYTTTTSLASTGGTDAWANQTETLPLRKGLNTIWYETSGGAMSGVQMDLLSVEDGITLADRGATVPYQELEAEKGTTNAEVLTPSREYLTVAAESSGRSAVKLSSTGRYVQWTAPAAANSLIVRYSMPDAPGGGGTEATLSLYVNGVKRQALNLSSKFAWTYGNYPYNDHPANGGAHHFYDESRFIVGDIPAGATVRLQKDQGDTASYYTLDLVNLEQVQPAYAMPADFVSVTDFGATANDSNDDTQALREAVQYAKSMNKAGVWIPAGIFRMNDRVNVDHVHIRGAGMWHTTLQGTNGKGGFYGTGGNVRIADLSIFGDSFYRNDAADHAGIEGNFGTGSLIQNVWIEHMKVGFWLQAGTDGLYITGGRVRNTWADGVNFHGGVKNTMISHFNVRNTGDDAFAMWSDSMPNENNLFRYNTAQIPVLANTFALYGGKANKVWDNIGADTVTASAGIAVSTRFNAVPFSGTTEIKRNTLLRTGGYEPNWNTSFGGLWIYAENQNITSPIVIEQADILDSTYEGIKFSYNQQISGIVLDGVNVDGAGTYGIYFDGVTGSGSFSNVVVQDAASGGLHNPNHAFQIVKGSGNSGW